MSASERLKALGAQMGGEDNEDAAYWLGRKMQEGLLPQIVAVVEAAEKITGLTADSQIGAALADLEEALS